MIWVLFLLLISKPPTPARPPIQDPWKNLQEDFAFCYAQLDQECMRATIDEAYQRFPHLSFRVYYWVIAADQLRASQETLASAKASAQRALDRLRARLLACPQCKGNNTITCLECDGAQHIAVTRRCHSCRNGQRTIPGESTICHYCNGSGRRGWKQYSIQGPFLEPRYTYSTCTSCQGTGYQPWSGAGSRRPTATTTACTFCDGKGNAAKRVLCNACKRGLAPCPRCHGDGRWGSRP